MAEKEKKVPWYEQKSFKDEKLAALQGLMPERRATRIVNRYLKSDAGQQAEADFVRAEIVKQNASRDAYLAKARQQIWDKYPAQTLTPTTEVPAQQATPAKPTLVPKSTAPVQTPQNAPKSPAVQPKSPAVQPRRVGGIDWDQRAREYGFKDQAEVAKWQATQPGLAVDGKFGDKSIERWRAAQQASQQAPQQGQTRTIDMPFSSLHGMEIPVVNPKTQPAVPQPEQAQPAAQQPSAPQTSGYTPRAFTLQDFNTHKNLRNPYHGHRTVAVDGKVYPVRVTTGLYGQYGIDNDQMYAFDESTGMIRQVDENMIGFPSGQGFAKGSQWIHPRFFYEEQWLQHNPAPAKRGPLGGNLTQEYEDWWKNQYHPAAQAGFRKQGGALNRINYFQQGGAAQAGQSEAFMQAVLQGDPQASQQLVQMAKNGNAQAAELIDTIMKEAQKGNQKVLKAAQTLSQLIQEQATAAKWGAKLNYIQSLKFAKGGKTCPACEKKVEMKACGGKKAKKRYFGGII